MKMRVAHVETLYSDSLNVSAHPTAQMLWIAKRTHLGKRSVVVAERHGNGRATIASIDLVSGAVALRFELEPNRIVIWIANGGVANDDLQRISGA